MEEKTDNTSGSEAAERSLSWADLSPHTYVKIAIIGFLMWFLYRVEIDKIVYRWVTDSSWSHGFLIPVFSLYFLHQNKDKILSLKPRPNYLGLLATIMLVFVAYPLNIVHLQIGYGRPLIVIATLGSIVLFMGGWKLIKYTWLPILYLIFAVPLPARIYRQITIPMRQFAAKIATALLNVVPDLTATAKGVVIDVLYKGKPLEPSLDVAEACSGMRLLMAFMALGVAMAYLHYRPAWQRIILLLSTVPIAILCNVVRVTVTGFIYVLGDPKYAQGIYHDMLGLAMLPLAFLIYGFLAWLMGNLFEEEKAEPEEVIIRRKSG